MFAKRAKWLAVVGMLVLGVHNGLEAAETPLTAIYVKNMHCASCAKKIAGKLYQVTGVAEVRANVEAGLAVVIPRPQTNPSPRAMWEAVQQAGFQPAKLAGPRGTFTSKPKS